MQIIRSVRLMLFALIMLAPSATLFAQIGVSITVGPPPLPVYEQPPCPAEGYIWTPGYWGYDNDDSDYYWVPGTWVEAPERGFLWTPGWWGWGGGAFVFHEGYWGPHVGFYGGINYGFGYFGSGFQGGRWDNGHFFYNRAVNNVNVTNIHNVYNTTVINNTTVNRVSYNGGNGGINARATAQEEAAEHERHVPPVAIQARHVELARSNPQLRASENQGKPPVAATPRAGEFHDHVVAAKEAGGPYHPPAGRGEPGARGGGNEQPGHPDNNVPRPGADKNEQPNHPENNNVPRPPNAVHPKDLPPAERPSPPNTGNAKTDKKYQQQQEKLYAKQDQERQKLQQKQEQEHQRLTQQKADEAKKQQVEQRHAQQTQELQQKHDQQQQHLQERQQPAHPNRAKTPNEASMVH